MGTVFWTYFLGSIGLFCFGYMVVMTPVHVVRNARARRAADPAVPDDEHVAFPDDEPAPARPHLTVVR